MIPARLIQAIEQLQRIIRFSRLDENTRYKQGRIECGPGGSLGLPCIGKGAFVIVCTGAQLRAFHQRGKVLSVEDQRSVSARESGCFVPERAFDGGPRSPEVGVRSSSRSRSLQAFQQ